MTRRILVLLSHGASNKEIAASLGISVPWVKKQLNRAYHELDVRDRTQAALMVRTMGLENE